MTQPDMDRELRTAGIHPVPLPLPGFSAAEARRSAERGVQAPTMAYIWCYVIQDGRRAVLIDPGWNTDDTHWALMAELRAIGTSLDSVDAIVVTHGHPDHCGMAVRLARELPATLVIGRLEAEALRRSRTAAYRSEYLDWLRRHGVPDERTLWFEQVVRGPRLPRDLRLVADGDAIKVGERSLAVLSTPGHTAGHICIFDSSSSSLFVGDHVLARITPFVSASPDGGDQGVQTYLDALDVVVATAPRHVFPGHQEAIGDLALRVRQIKDHHARRTVEIAGVVARSEVPLTAWEVATTARWSADLDQLPMWMRYAAFVETLAHLEHGERLAMVRRCTTTTAHRWGSGSVDAAVAATPSA